MSDSLNRYMVNRRGSGSHRLPRFDRYENYETKPPSGRNAKGRRGAGEKGGVVQVPQAIFTKRTHFAIRVLGVHSWFNPEITKRSHPHPALSHPTGEGAGTRRGKIAKRTHCATRERRFGRTTSQFDVYEKLTKRTHRSARQFKVPALRFKVRHQRNPRYPRLNENYETKPTRNPKPGEADFYQTNPMTSLA